MLDRQFEATAPNRKWVADFTYIWTAEGWLYVAAVHRPVLAPSGRLVDERGHDGRTRHRRAGDGDLAARHGRTSCCIIPTAAANTRASSSSG